MAGDRTGASPEGGAFRLVPPGGHLAANAAAADGHPTHGTLAWRLSQDNSRSSVPPTHDKFGIRVALLIVSGMESRRVLA
jgi:hypothetical protein